MKKLASIIALSLISSISYAADNPTHDKHNITSEIPTNLSTGEVRKVDKYQNKITIKHGPLANLDMPSMTMVFRVKDNKMLNAVTQGDVIQFKAEMVGGYLTIIYIEKQK